MVAFDQNEAIPRSPQVQNLLVIVDHLGVNWSPSKKSFKSLLNDDYNIFFIKSSFITEIFVKTDIILFVS